MTRDTEWKTGKKKQSQIQRQLPAISCLDENPLLLFLSIWTLTDKTGHSFIPFDIILFFLPLGLFFLPSFFRVKMREEKKEDEIRGMKKEDLHSPFPLILTLTSLFTCFVYFWSPVGLKFSLKVKDRQTDVMQLSMFLLQCNTWRINAFTPL